MLPHDATREEIQAFFAHDRFATEVCGVEILHAEPGHVICVLKVEDRHLNAMGNVMGGALFTLADFALAITCNLGEAPTVSVGSTIEYLKAVQGGTLTAECTTDRSGRSMGFYTIEIKDESGVLLAKMTSICARKGA